MASMVRCVIGAVGAIGLAWMATAGAASDEAKAPREVRVFLLSNGEAPVVAKG